MSLRLQEEAARLPANALACGQYLDHPNFEQRGLYGTAAAIRVLADEATSSPTHAEQIAKMLVYVVNRSQVERTAVSPSVYRDLIARRIRLQRSDVFRMADVGFSLTFVSSVIPLRDQALTLIQRVLSDAQNQPSGYAVGSEGGEPNPLATAHALRCLAANNLPTRREDWRYLQDYLLSGDDIYVKCFILYVLATFDREADRKLLQSSFKTISSSLSREFNAQTEANHEYTRDNAQDYVRIPWQVYLIQACARLFPLTKFNSFSIQQKLASIAMQIASTEGFRYDASGKYLSTRTYACVWQALSEVLGFNYTSPMPRFAISFLSGVTRVLSSRLSYTILFALMAVVAILSFITWIHSSQHSIGDLTPNLLTELVLVILARASVGLRKR